AGRSAAAAGAAATLADVAGPGRPHLRAAGHADRGVGGLALELLQELGGGVDLRLDRSGVRGAGAGLHLDLDSLLLLRLPLGRRGSRLAVRLELTLDVTLVVGRRVRAGLELPGPLLRGVDAHVGPGL